MHLASFWGFLIESRGKWGTWSGPRPISWHCDELCKVRIALVAFPGTQRLCSTQGSETSWLRGKAFPFAIGTYLQLYLLLTGCSKGHGDTGFLFALYTGNFYRISFQSLVSLSCSCVKHSKTEKWRCSRRIRGELSQKPPDRKGKQDSSCSSPCAYIS